MRHVNLAAVCAVLCMSLAQPVSAAPSSCGASGIALQVLGSGGPEAANDRASSGYLVWQDGRARLLVDAGSGITPRFGASGAKIEDLELIAISHLHADHSAALLGLVKAGFFSERAAPLPVSGPPDGEAFAGMKRFVTVAFDAKQGAYPYLSWALDGEGGPFTLKPQEVTGDGVTRVLEADGLAVDAVSVAHGPVPALGYLVTIGDKRIAFTGDQNGDNPVFWEIAKGADLAIAHSAIPEDAGKVETALHARPSEIGRNAAGAGVAHLVLSHLMLRSLATLDENVAIIGKAFDGKIDVATDLACYPLN